MGQGEVCDSKKPLNPNIYIYKHGDPRFDEIMQECLGMISTAGHSLLSEAMYLGIPTYAIPVSPYEQHMNAMIIDKNNFGIAYHKIDFEKLAEFIVNIPKFREAIKSDKEVLMRGAGQEKIIALLNKFLPY